ncbi:type I glyceraldehyde-3-phosphate dehydrogenase [Oceaniovalibus sp. ACAM 378]|uniref:type I glyceraldehyde-3-phosphate dehydrogenase n=1 Tax=Oceaniovalibus sp. ACAM 378 TaxID=2599923 RepID=UPI0011DA66F0|nr:glyceraldehyde 3-phosphate dehydrogenase NAD-binding domain-containing protein [Oceaniovalibus sp. ACAM 378]TYB87037.1 glyceraldehyde-3-phosphate dehydrogenase [Oceaniovalibus sp. ACAM 378]
MKIVINGFGRIGRTILRALATTRAGEPVEVVAINDIAAPDLLAYLFQYDSVFGPFPGDVTLDGNILTVNGRAISMSRSDSLSGLDLTGIDLVLECTGKADDREVAMRGLRAGAARVLISGPSDAADVTVVLGANDAAVNGQEIVSNASCTTNALAPLLALLDGAFGIEQGHMTTIHCYTGSQPMIDAPRGDPARSRAGALSMVPTTTSATRLIDRVLPQLAGRITGAAVRVPVASVSAVDLVVRLRGDPGPDEIRAALRQGCGPILGWTDLPLVSSDLRARPESLVIAGPELIVQSGGMARVFGWYDNEWGFSNRMIDLALRMV